MNHKDLDVWKHSVELAASIYEVTKCFPEEEKFGLTSQMRRAAVSIPSNISEGAARSGAKEFIRFLQIAAGSASELNTQLLISQKIGILGDDQRSTLDSRLSSISKQIQGLMKHLRQRC